jgi:hypothetical protein
MIMELMNEQVTEQVEVQIALLCELADVQLAVVGGGFGAVIFDD